MRIGAMSVDRNDRRMCGCKIALFVLLQDKLLDLDLSHWNLAQNAPSNFLHNLIDDLAHVLRSIQMGFKLLVAPNSFKNLNQIRR